MITLNRKEYEKIKYFEEETLTDYEIKRIVEDELEHFYIEEDSLKSLVEDLLVHYHRKVEELEDLQNDIVEYYQLKKDAMEVE